ncbi:MAG TPA: hypothetical protein VMV10_30975 [Pirellulales bacterium]|nr:hypothetical protein [Pirellulales bacterium]
MENSYGAALKFFGDERFHPADRLLQSAGAERNPDYEEAWSAEIARRIQKLRMER